MSASNEERRTEFLRNIQAVQRQRSIYGSLEDRIEVLRLELESAESEGLSPIEVAEIEQDLSSVQDELKAATKELQRLKSEYELGPKIRAVKPKQEEDKEET